MPSPTEIPTQALLASLHWRYAVKKFDATRRIPDAEWSALEQSLLLSPSSFGLQPWKFIVVHDAALRAKLRPASWNQSQITDASHLVVLARKRDTGPEDIELYVQRIMAVRGVTAAAVAEYKNMMLGSLQGMDADTKDTWAAKQVYIALGFFLEAAALLGIDACPMEGIDADKYDAMLGLPARGYATTVAATAGYRAADDFLAPLAKVRFPYSQVIEHV